MHNLSYKHDNNTTYHSQFREISQQIAQLGASLGKRIVPYRDPELPYFSQLDGLRRKKIIHELSTYLSICEAAIAAGDDLLDSKKLIWHAIKMLGLLPPSNMFNFITEEDIIEVHNRDLQQMFRNFIYYDYCSYSIEEIESIPFPQLYTREKGDIKDMLKIADDVFSGKIKSTIPLEGIVHTVAERISPFKYRMDYEFIYVAPLKDKSTHQVVAWLMGERAELFDYPHNSLEEEKLLDNFYKTQKIHEIHPVTQV